MLIPTERMTYEDLERLPDDGKRYEIIDGALYVSITPTKAHQRLSMRLMLSIIAADEKHVSGEPFFGPVDVRFSDYDQVQPDIIYIRRERAAIYQGSTVSGPPDLVIEILSPEKRTYDAVIKARLYERGGVPELMLADPDTPALRLFVLREGRHVQVMPDDHGRLHSSVVPDLVFDPPALLVDLHA